jgi:hypothetical protein
VIGSATAPQNAFDSLDVAEVRALHDRRARRFRRMRALPGFVIAAGLFDLVCTLSAYRTGWLVESNPLASSVLAAHGAVGLAGYRFVLTAAGCILLSWGLRAHRARRFSDSRAEHVRTGIVISATQAFVVASHAALAAWWVAWLSV